MRKRLVIFCLIASSIAMAQKNNPKWVTAPKTLSEVKAAKTKNAAVTKVSQKNEATNTSTPILTKPKTLSELKLKTTNQKAVITLRSEKNNPPNNQILLPKTVADIKAREQKQ